ncbi:KTSC domain-containing protein [Flavobacterium sp.]|uniref:KTSC domain-containing protein n=1 Tax=Flavobacterium sp. TaxID=239 RepID=UPI00286C4B11|nr:KTSC domain-containing protein [Flavobacterium sp.]
MKKLYLIITLLIGLNSYSQNCNQLSKQFRSFEQATKLISNTTFTFSENADVSNSSWITSAKYYSCDNKTGFFVIKTSNKTYIHQNVPKTVWQNFIKAKSKGSFYSKNIREKYQLNLK